MTMLRAETFHPRDLTDEDAAQWRRLAAAHPAFSSPLLGPDFARAVGLVRADARVTVWRWPGRPAGFLAYQLRPGAFARPIGAPLSDYHALVAEEGLDLDEALETAGLSAYRFSGLIDPWGKFDASTTGERESFAIELTEGADAYLEALRVASPKRHKNTRRLDHKLGREIGKLRIVAPDTNPATFETLIAWKRDQFARTGGHDVLRPAWTRDLLKTLFETTEGEFRGLMIGLYAGDRLVGGHFGVRLGETYHPWIAATDPELAAWSPGQVFFPRAIEAMPELGLKTYDLGPGHEHYKRPYALCVRQIGEGLAVAASTRGRAALASERAWSLAGARSFGAVDRVRRRLDAIAAVELSLSGRALGFAQALAARARRDRSAEAA